MPTLIEIKDYKNYGLYALDTKTLKAKINADLGLKVMVNKGTKGISVWLFPADRNKETRSIIDEYLKKNDIVVNSPEGPRKPWPVNGGEWNSLMGINYYAATKY